MSKSKQINKPLSIEEKVKQVERVAEVCNPLQRSHVVEAGLKELDELNEGEKSEVPTESNRFKMLTLFEMDNGLLLTRGATEAYKVLVVDHSKQLQVEYACTTPSQKSVAHISAQNFVKVLELQNYIKRLLDRETFSDLTTKRIAVLEKALERAENRYLRGIMTLQRFHQPHMNITVKATTANIANQQMVQENHEVKG